MTVQVQLDSTDEERLNLLAKLQQRDPGRLLSEAVREYLDRADVQISFKEEALASWRAFQENGLHLTLDEAEQWLEGWGTSAETPAPECHK